MTNEEVQKEMIAAMKAKDKVRLSIIRQVKAEVKILESLLPAQVSGEELEALIEQVIAELGATSKKQMGQVMGALGKATGGNFDKPAAAKIVGAKLA